MSVPSHLQEKCVFKIQDFTPICSQGKWKQKHQQQQQANNNSFCFSCNIDNEPTSVLHMRRSQSPPTSASTLSSSLNNTNTTTTNSVPQEPVSPLLNNERKDEWATELLSIPNGLEVIPTGAERCGLGLEDWETMLSESGQEQSILKWIAGDVDDSPFGLKQLLQSGGNGNGQNPFVDFDGNAGGGGLGFVDQPPNFESVGGGGSLASGNFIATNLCAFSGSELLSNNNGNGKIGSSPGLVNLNHKVVSGVGLNSSNSNNNCNYQNPIFGSPTSSNVSLAPVSLPPGVNIQQSQNFVEAPEEKPQILNPQIFMNNQQVQSQHHQNPNFFFPVSAYPLHQENHHHSHLLQPQPKRHNSGGSLDLSSPHVPKPPFSDPRHEFLLRNHQQQMGFYQNVHFLPQHFQQKSLIVSAKQKVLSPGSEEMSRQQHALLDQLYKAAELVGTGNFSHAQGILARLNHQVFPVGKPLQRAAFYFKEALQLFLLMNNQVTNPPPRSPTPVDVIFKMGAYKVFSEVSPLIQFINFTCNQALLEALDDADRIHIVDFDIGFGAQWASFMQELSMRSNRGTPSMKITAFASPSTHHHIELGLMRENLTQFANAIGVSFDLDVINFESLDQTSYTLPIIQSSENEAVAVNFPIWSSSNQPSALPSLLRFVKQLSPKIVVSADRGCDKSDLPFPEHILHALQSYINLLESLDAVNVMPDALNKIERFLLQPRIESVVLGRLRGPDRMPMWKTLFASAGFSPVTFSNFTETQAECVVKRTPVRGFHVEKRQASLVLCWQQRELISASAWRC
ncbi:Scarecrow-like protein 6 [Citrus sinensis]|uniref:Scarecrow-like protein 6 n=1 Tax=Citrus sinensis TaxID=2711 RepID=A0ACB8LVI1_CITSI|nr:Scarecrow-like protein 6 [Citrus sinensis]